jgi:hypothetical protein
MKFLLVLLALTTLCAHAQRDRWIDLEWDAVPGVKNYEVELFEEVGGEQKARGRFRSETPFWTHPVPPGKYSLRLRSLDTRGVPGPWSEQVPLKVRLQNPQALRPVAQMKLTEAEVTFEWSEVPGAATYQLLIKDDRNKIFHTATLEGLSQSVYLETLGEYQWAVVALEQGEAPKELDDIPSTFFRGFSRVGGDLEAPWVSLSVNEKVSLTWDKVRFAQHYEVDYLPPPEARDKSRRFKLPRQSLVFPAKNLRQGITTITVRASAAGHKQSAASMVKLSKTGDKVEVVDIIQGRPGEVVKVDPTRAHWRNQFSLSLGGARYDYSSTVPETDTRLEQEKLTGLGLNLEWVAQPRMNSAVHRVDLGVINLSSGLKSGLQTRLAYAWTRLRPAGSGRWYYGAGASYLNLPAFMGNRIEDSVKVEMSSSLGPELVLGHLQPFGQHWALHSQLNYGYHLYHMNSARSGQQAFPYLRAQVKILKYVTKKEAIFAGVDYQQWDRQWSQESSKLSGFAFHLGAKAGF